ncbi:hypothetical protein [Alteriqipengyuania sp.]|uniref:hypothetical protein n=1 Tax=Alteriqipengyuania sp. TaxID=2800692 RepID=UPI003517CB62
MIGFALDGIDEARRKRADAVRPVNARRIGTHAAEVLEPIAEDARRLVRKRTGRLEASILVAPTFAFTGETDGQSVSVGVLDAGGDGVFWGHFEEFGTVFSRGSPFLTPAVYRNIDLVFTALGKRVGEDMTGAI